MASAHPYHPRVLQCISETTSSKVRVEFPFLVLHLTTSWQPMTYCKWAKIAVKPNYRYLKLLNGSIHIKDSLH